MGLFGGGSGADWLIAGLGNPEPKYDGTRHNTGFAALDALADKWNISVGKTKFQGQWGQGEVDGHKVVLLKPLTYMNLSGDSIAPMAGFFKIPADHVLVLGDAIELPEEIDAKRAAEAAERAKERLLHKQSIMQYYHSQAALNRAMNRLKISKRHNHEI